MKVSGLTLMPPSLLKQNLRCKEKHSPRKVSILPADAPMPCSLWGSALGYKPPPPAPISEGRSGRFLNSSALPPPGHNWEHTPGGTKQWQLMTNGLSCPQVPSPLSVTMETPASWSQEIRKCPKKMVWWTQVLGGPMYHQDPSILGSKVQRWTLSLGWKPHFFPP